MEYKTIKIVRGYEYLIEKFNPDLPKDGYSYKRGKVLEGLRKANGVDGRYVSIYELMFLHPEITLEQIEYLQVTEHIRLCAIDESKFPSISSVPSSLQLRFDTNTPYRLSEPVPIGYVIDSTEAIDPKRHYINVDDLHLLGIDKAVDIPVEVADIETVEMYVLSLMPDINIIWKNLLDDKPQNKTDAFQLINEYLGKCNKSRIKPEWIGIDCFECFANPKSTQHQRNVTRAITRACCTANGYKITKTAIGDIITKNK